MIDLIQNIIVRTDDFSSTTGILTADDLTFDCTLGAKGLTLDKQEGDQKTPVGIFPMRYVLYRADRLEHAPRTSLPLKELTLSTGWCEDPTHKDYNKQVTLPHAGVCDHMTRKDHLYDVTVILGQNDDPIIPYRGSAIFMHIARTAFTPTQGCIGLRQEDLLTLIRRCSEKTMVTVLPPSG